MAVWGISDYSDEIMVCIDEIKRSREEKDFFRLEKYCARMLENAEQEQSGRLYGLAYYYMGEVQYCLGNYEKVLFYLMKAVNYLQEVEEHHRLASTYNMLGNVMTMRGDYSAGIEYYLNSIEVCRNHGITFEYATVAGNLARVYFFFQDYSGALELFEVSNHQFEAAGTDTIFENHVRTIMGIGFCSLYLDEKDRARKCGKWLNNFLNAGTATQGLRAEILIYLGKLEAEIGSEEQSKSYLHEIPKLLDQVKALLEAFYLWRIFFELLLKYRMAAESRKAMRIIQNKETEFDSMHEAVLQVLEMNIMYCLVVGDDEKYLEYSKRYFKELDKMRESNLSVPRKALELQNEVGKIRKKQFEMVMINEKLLEQSLHDAMTGLANRVYFNDYIAQTLEKARAEKKHIGVEILDIDYFKLVNDTYGHIIGDDYLIQVAGVLEEWSDKDMFCARYGGDEFVVIFYDKKKEEVELLAQELRKRILDLRLPNEKSPVSPYITISQGIFNSIPSRYSKVWGYMLNADNALYNIKRNSRNNLVVETVHPVKLVRDEDDNNTV